MFYVSVCSWGQNAYAERPVGQGPPVLPAQGGAAARFQGTLGSQLNQLRILWSDLGTFQVLPTTLLERGATRNLPLPASALDEESPGCATVVLLSAANISYVLSFGAGGLPISQRAWPVPSAAGAAAITRCGTRKKLLRELQVQMLSRRGILETAVLLSVEPPAAVSDVLKGRDPGESLPSPQIGQRPYLQSLADRVPRKIAQLLRDSAEEVLQQVVPSDETGRGSQVLTVAEGCHRFLVLAPQDKNAPPDIDAHLFELTQGELLVSDEEQAGEASLIKCVGRPERLRLDYNGSHPKVEVTILHARYTLPPGLPRAWGSETRAALAEALMRSGGPAPEHAPMISALGVRGATEWEVELRESACYLVMAAPIRGDSRRISITTSLGLVERRAQSFAANSGVALTFCAPSRGSAQVKLHSLGTAVAWVMGIWSLETSTASNSSQSPAEKPL